MCYLSVMLWIASCTCSSTFKLHLYNLFFMSVLNNFNFNGSSRICRSFDFVFSIFGVILEKFVTPVWNVLLNAVKEGNITLNVYNIPINFGLFNDLEKPFAIEPPDPRSVSNILNVSHKRAYFSYTPSTDACKLSHLVLTAFFIS